jgi:hypothetical protein
LKKKIISKKKKNEKKKIKNKKKNTEGDIFYNIEYSGLDFLEIDIS